VITVNNDLAVFLSLKRGLVSLIGAAPVPTRSRMRASEAEEV
jgi:hypothetical protein